MPTMNEPPSPQDRTRECKDEPAHEVLSGVLLAYDLPCPVLTGGRSPGKLFAQHSRCNVGLDHRYSDCSMDKNHACPFRY